MKKLLPLLLALLLALSACGPAAGTTEDTAEAGTVVVATTYPVYLFASAVTEGVEGYNVELMIDQPVSCLHDYTLSVNDMRTLEAADVIVMNGAGLEETMEDALSSVGETPVIDCSAGMDLLPSQEDPQEPDPHIWMDPELACGMLSNLAEGLTALDPDHSAAFAANADGAVETIRSAHESLKTQLADLPCRELITFHDGFQYFARAFDLTILRAIEEEAGSEASAKEVGDILADIDSYGLPAVFTELNGSTSTADLIAREAGIQTAPLDLLMSRTHTGAEGIDEYVTRLTDNITTIQEAYS